MKVPVLTGKKRSKVIIGNLMKQEGEEAENINSFIGDNMLENEHCSC